MNILFVCSGNSQNGISPIVFNQGESLKKEGVNIEYFTIKGKGLKGYLKNILPLKKQIKANKYDLIHAHFSLSAFTASLAGASPLVVSLMGSDVKSKNSFIKLIKMFNYIFNWRLLIVKSSDMKTSLGIKSSVVIPNGVNISKYYPENIKKSQEKINWNTSKINILFAADPSRFEKNFNFTQEAVNKIKTPTIELYTLVNIPNSDVPQYLNAADIILLSSLWEGSPNIIKEAMACNKVIVSTDVGDVKMLFGNEIGLFINPININEYIENIEKALIFIKTNPYSNGRNRIIDLKLDDKSIALTLIEKYKNILNDTTN